ncbi:phage tail family protein [Clostridium sp.]|jgi:hypothetical protein|uniref:phage tail family protein n=1 Tax=Clostridium sp. TaxID=1506 RepID=UPI003A127CF1
MDYSLLSLKFKSGNNILQIEGNSKYKILEIEGIESSDIEINMADKVQSDGSMVVSKRILPRPIMVKIEYNGEDKDKQRKRVISFFNPKRTGTLYISYLEVTYAIEYEIENFEAKLTNIYDPLVFTIDLICPKAFLNSEYENKQEIALWVGDFEFPLEIPQNTEIEMGHRAPSLIVNVLNTGDVECGMRIVFKAIATLTNPSLFNVNTREYIKINKEMTAGERITITTGFGNKRIVDSLNGVETNAFKYIELGSTFLQLDVGDNLFRYDADTGLDNLECEIYFTPQYLGV